MGTGVEIPICCEKPMKKSGSAYEQGEGWWDRYVCRVYISEKIIKIGDAKK